VTSSLEISILWLFYHSLQTAQLRLLQHAPMTQIHQLRLHVLGTAAASVNMPLDGIDRVVRETLGEKYRPKFFWRSSVYRYGLFRGKPGHGPIGILARRSIT